MTAMATNLPALWAAVLTHLWQTTLVLGPVLILSPLLRRLPARWGELVWSLALLKLMVPAALLVDWLQEIPRHLALLVSPRQLLAGMALGDRVNPVWTAPEIILQGGDAGGSGWSLPPTVALPLAALLTSVWLAGALVVLVRLQVRWEQARELRRQPAVPLGPEAAARLNVLAQRAGIPRGDVVPTRAVPMPQVVGLRRPVILLPVGLLASLDDDELVAILLHEQGHRRRRDPLRELVYGLVQALWIIHPLVPVVIRRLRDNAEFAADEAALRGVSHPDCFARALAGSVLLSLDPARTPTGAMASAMAGGGPSLLRRRLERLDPLERRSSMKKTRWALLLALAVLAVGTLLPVALAQDAPPPPPPPPPAPAPDGAAEPGAVATLTADPPPPPPSVVEVSARDSEVVVVKLDSPEYPEEARKKGIAGTVVVKVTLDKQGKMLEKEVLEGPPELRQAALDAVDRSEFKVKKKDGDAVRFQIALPFVFRLD